MPVKNFVQERLVVHFVLLAAALVGLLLLAAVFDAAFAQPGAFGAPMPAGGVLGC